MKTVQLREAKARLSTLVEAAEKGEPTIVTKHGREAAMLVPIDEARKLYPKRERPRFIDYLMSIPGDLDIERDQTPVREIDL